MNPKTPKFNEALNQILENLKPQKRTCRECEGEFEIMAEDIDFYKKLQVPPPTLCPQCRMQRRMAHRVILPIFYKKTCSAPGHTEKVISFFSENNPVKVYDDQYYSSDQWEATEFATEYQPGKSFFEQFKKFKLSVPHQASSRDLNSIKCEYTVSGNNSKNCYYSAAPMDSENVHYSVITLNTKNSQDLADVDNSELCYDSVYLNRCYNVRYSRESSHCLNSAFLFDCKHCSDCFMSANLRHKQYVFYNQQLTKEEYQQKIAELDLGDRNVIKKLKKDFQQIQQEAIYKNLNNEKIENSIGNLLRECHDCYWAVRVFGGSENTRYVHNGHSLKDSMDIYGALGAELCYESSGMGVGVNNLKFSMMTRGGMYLEYCTDCTNCEYCFACVGLKNKKYHIFNKSYSQEEYWKKVDEIKTEMLQNGEYGEFFPVKNSIHPYQDTIAGVDYPLTEEEVAKKNWPQSTEEESEIDLSKIQTVTAEKIPSNIKDVSNDILNTPVICERTGKPFKITPFELDFYRQQNIPLPTLHPLERIKERAKYHYGFKLYQDKCANCHQEILSAHNPQKGLLVYCERCYNEKVI